MDIVTLVTELKTARDFYYNGKPIMTDFEFDSLENKLRELDPDNAYFRTVGTPSTRGVKVKHRIPMGSLDQLNETDEINRWANKLNDQIYIFSHKLDGNSIAIYYDEEGKFESAVTRGDGIEGLDVTRHFRRILASSYQKTVPSWFLPNAAVRAEVIMDPAIFAERVTGYKNPRNYVAGQLNRTVADENFIDLVSIVAFDATIAERSTYDKVAILDLLDRNGFEVVEHVIVSAGDNSSITTEELTETLDKFKVESRYELDGVVVEAASPTIRSAAGFNHLNPNYSFKFKINQNFVDTTVKAVYWKASKDGYLKPRVEFEPVDLAGVTISFATGFNAKFIKDNNIGAWSVIRVTRSGDVIPFIQSVIHSTSADMPDEDDVGTFHWSDTNVDLILDELPDSSRILEAVDFFTSIDAPMLKEGNVTKLFDAGFDSISSIIMATEDELIVVLGENGSKVFMGLKDKLTNIDEYALVGSLPFVGRGVGKRKMKKLAEVYGAIDNLSKEQILAIEGFEDITSSKIAHGLIQYRRFMLNHKNYISVVPFVRIDGDLNHIAVCFTGVRDKTLEKMIEDRGGKINSSVTKGTTHLVAKDPLGKSSKLDKARKQGIEIISLEEAESLWG